ncbi:hypothetical protein JCM10207_005707 [Rhodosporidiobolus poonsookiae]
MAEAALVDAASSAPSPGPVAGSTISRLDALESAFEGTLSDATNSAKEELRRLIAYQAPPAKIDFPKRKLAAVLVLLHLNPLGELSVTLTTRSLRLRSHPGETALPGGRWEEGDGEGGEWTALREAYEEIGLPLPRPSPSSPPDPDSHLLHLTTLPAFTSRTLLVVVPVVYLLVKPASSASQEYLPSTLQPNPDEVDAVFHLPLRAFLLLPDAPPNTGPSATAPLAHKTAPEGPSATSFSPTESSPPAKRPRTRSTAASSSSSAPSRPPPGTERLTHSFQDFTWLLDCPYRLHHFSHPAEGVTPSAVTGLTADIVIEVALLAAYGREGLDNLRIVGPQDAASAVTESAGAGSGETIGAAGDSTQATIGFERHAPGQMSWEAIVSEAMRTQGQLGLGGEVRARPQGGDERTSAT